MKLQCAFTPTGIAKLLNSNAMDKTKHWETDGCNTYTGEGMLEAFNWLA